MEDLTAPLSDFPTLENSKVQPVIAKYLYHLCHVAYNLSRSPEEERL